MIQPIPTTRFVVEPSLVCPLRCRACYHYHTHDTWKFTVKPFEEVKKTIDDGISRGNNYMDFTGGEPIAYPHIRESIEYGLSKGVKSCIITSGIFGESLVQGVIDSGVDDFLVSRHGLREVHDSFTQCKGAYNRQLQFLNYISGKVSFRFNCVISKFNQNDIYDIAIDMAHNRPRIVNFINMNPHHQWMSKEMETREVIADLRVVEPLLTAAIEYLEVRGIGVNIRYFPMCRIAEEYRRCVCNDRMVIFDPYEWDYQITPKTFNAFNQWGINASNCNEEKGAPCNTCNLQWICGGANRQFHKASNQVYGEVLIPQKVEGIDKNDFYFYRKDNNLTLNERI